MCWRREKGEKYSIHISNCNVGESKLEHTLCLPIKKKSFIIGLCQLLQPEDFRVAWVLYVSCQGVVNSTLDFYFFWSLFFYCPRVEVEQTVGEVGWRKRCYGGCLPLSELFLSYYIWVVPLFSAIFLKSSIFASRGGKRMPLG